ncbi:polysaccharide deacetylase [Halanaerobium saccharolyticum]|uniref:Polysaccharide deacetylase n=1 Tax=Halanaerobium saccharolyticum TaxID=43595 RepID=A0A4R6M1N7_9FIRM|nr:polysaccharide deacetylase family protein [Halanaerobium saccharolyticum]TDO95147.1 polysaccharide deacetylase [Halanaerobium saccharolyticum]
MKKIMKCFPDGKHKVLTLSYDDGKKADKKLVNILNKFNIKATFHLNSGLMDQDQQRIQPEEIKNLYQGHEVAAHTATHPTLARCPGEKIVAEVMGDRRQLEKIVEYSVRGFSYPNGSYNQKIKKLLPELGLEYARIVGNSNNFSLPEDLYSWQATCHHNHNLMEFAEKFSALKKEQYLYMMYVWGHSYEFDRDQNWELIEKFCRYISDRDDIWYAANIEIVDYLKALDNLIFAADCSFVYNPSVLPVWLNVEGEKIKIDGGAKKKIN